MRKIVVGVDEAGRGPVLGPMVICGVAFAEERLGELEEMRVRDSKLLTPQRRSTLAKLIRGAADGCEVIEVPARKIDEFRLVKKVKLNQLEAVLFAKAINRLRPSRAYVDSADVDPIRFSKNIQRHLKVDAKLIVEHRADEKYPLVSAASIVAKVHRDERIGRLRELYGRVGSGYPADKVTIQFLERWVREHGRLPDFARKSWKTSRRILAEYAQGKLK